MRKYKIKKKDNVMKDVNIDNIFNYVNNKKNEGKSKIILILYLCKNLKKKHIENSNNVLILYFNLLHIFEEHLIKIFKRRIIINRKEKYYEKNELEENFSIRINKLQLNFSYIILHISYFLTLNKNYRKSFTLQLFIYYIHILTFIYLQKYIFQKEKKINEVILYLCYINILLLILINIYKFKLHEILNKRNFYIISKYMFAIIYLFSHIKRNGNERKLSIFFYDYIYNVMIILIDKYCFYLKKKNKITYERLTTFYKNFIIFIYNYISKFKVFKYVESYLLSSNKSIFYNLTLLSIIKNTIDIHFLKYNHNEIDLKNFYTLKFKNNLEEKIETSLIKDQLNNNFEDNKIDIITNYMKYNESNNCNDNINKKDNILVNVNYKTINYIIFLKLLKLAEVLLIKKDRIFLTLYIYRFINKIANNTIKEIYKCIKKKKNVYLNKCVYYRLLLLYEFYFNILFFIINEEGKNRKKESKKYNKFHIYFVENSFLYIYEIYMLLIILLSRIRSFYKIFNKNNFSLLKRILYIRKCNNYIIINSITKLICDCFFSQSLFSFIILKCLFKNNKKLNYFLQKRIHIYTSKRKFFVIINNTNIYMNNNKGKDKKFKINKNKIKIIQDNNFNKLKIFNTNLYFDENKGFHTCVNSYIKVNFLLKKENYEEIYSNIIKENKNLEFYNNNVTTEEVKQDSKVDGKINEELIENYYNENKIIYNKRCSENKEKIYSENLKKNELKYNNFNREIYDNKLITDCNLIFKRSSNKVESEQIEQTNYRKIYFLLLMNNFISDIKKKKKYFIEYNCRNYLAIYVNKLHYYCNNIFNNKSLFRHNLSSFIRYNLKKNTNFIESITSFNRKLNFYNKKISEKKKFIFKNKIVSLKSIDKKHNTTKYIFLKKILNYKNKYFNNENYYFNFLFNIKFLHNLNDNINEYFLFKKKKNKKKMLFNISINLKDKIKKMKYSSNNQYTKSVRSFSLNSIEEKSTGNELLIGDTYSNKLQYEQKSKRRKKNILYFFFLNYNYCIFNYEKNEQLQYFLLEILKYFEAIIPYINIYKYICAYLLFIISIIEKKPLEYLNIYMIDRNFKTEKKTNTSKEFENLENKHTKKYEKIFIDNLNKKSENSVWKFLENNKFSNTKRNINDSNYFINIKNIHEMGNGKNKYSNIFKEKRTFYEEENLNEIIMNKIKENYEYIERNVIQHMRNIKDKKFSIFHKGRNKMILKVILGITDKIKIYLFSNIFHYLYKSKTKYSKYINILSLYFYKLYFTLIYVEIYKKDNLNRKEIEMIKNKVIQITPILSIKYINKNNIKNLCKNYILENLKENKIHDNIRLNFTNYERLYIYIIYYIEGIRKKEDILYCFFLLIDKNIFSSKFLHKNIKKLIKYKIYGFLNELNSFNNYNFINTTLFLLMNIMNYNKIIRNYIYCIFDHIFKLKLSTLYDNTFLVCFLKNLEKSSLDYAFSKILYDEKKTFKNIIDKKKNKMIKIIYKINLCMTINYLLLLKILNGCKLFLNLYSYFYYEFYIFCFNKYAKKYKNYLIRNNKLYKQIYPNIKKKKKKKKYFLHNSIDIKEHYKKKKNNYMDDNKNSLISYNDKKKSSLLDNIINSSGEIYLSHKVNKNINEEKYRKHINNFYNSNLEILDRSEYGHLTNRMNTKKMIQHTNDKVDYYNLSSENLFLIHMDEKSSSTEMKSNKKLNFSNKHIYVNKKLKKDKRYILNDNNIKMPKYTMSYSKNFYNRRPYTLFKKYNTLDNYTRILRKKRKTTYLNSENGFSDLFENYIKNDYFENEAIDNDLNYFKILKKIKGSNTHIYNIYDIKISKKVIYCKKYFKEYLNIINFLTCIFLATNVNNLNMSMLNNNYIYIISKIIKKNFKFYFFFFYYNIFKNKNKRYKNIYNVNFNIILSSSIRKNFNISKISIKNKYIYVLYTLSCILSIYDYKYAFFNYYFFFFYKFVKILAKLSLKSASISNFLIDKFSNYSKNIDDNKDQNKSKDYNNSIYKNNECVRYFYFKSDINEDSEKKKKEKSYKEKIILNDSCKFLADISKNKNKNSYFISQIKDCSNEVKKKKKRKIVFNNYEQIFVVSDIVMIKNYINNYIRKEDNKIHNNLKYNRIANKNTLDQYIKYINNAMIIYIFINYMILMNDNMNLSKKRIIKNKLKLLEDYKIYLMKKIIDIYFLNIPYLCNYLVVTLEFYFVFSNSFLSLNYNNFMLIKDMSFFFKNSYIYFLTNMFNKLQNLKTFYHINFYKNSNLYFHNFKKFQKENLDFSKNKTFNYICSGSNSDLEKYERKNKNEEGYLFIKKRDKMKIAKDNCTKIELNEKYVNGRYSCNSSNNIKKYYNVLNNNSTYSTKESNMNIKENEINKRSKNKKEERNTIKNYYTEDSLSEYNDYIHKDTFIELKEIFKKKTKEYIKSYYDRNIKNICFLFRCLNDITSICLFLNFYINSNTKINEKYNHICFQSMNNIYLYNFRFSNIGYNFISIIFIALIKIFNYTSKFFHSYNYFVQLYSKYKYNYFLYLDDSNNFFTFYNVYNFSVKKGKNKKENFVNIDKEISGFCISEIYDFNKLLLQKSFIFLTFFFHNFNNIISDIYCINCSNKYSMGSHDKNTSLNDLTKEYKFKNKKIKNIFINSNKTNDFFPKRKKKCKKETEENKEYFPSYMKKEKKYSTHVNNDDKNKDRKEKEYLENSHENNEQICKSYKTIKTEKKSNNFSNLQQIEKMKINHNYKKNKASYEDYHDDDNRINNFRKYTNNIYSYFKKKVSYLKHINYDYFYHISKRKNASKKSIKYTYNNEIMNKINNNNNIKKINDENMSINEKKNNEYDYDLYSLKDNEDDLNILNAYKYMLNYQKTHKKTLYDYNLKEELSCICINKYIYICNLIYNYLIYILEMKYKYKKRKLSIVSYNLIKKKIKNLESFSNNNDKNYNIINTKHLLNLDFIILSILYLLETIYINLYKCKLFTDMCIFNNIKYICLENNELKRNDGNKYKNTEYTSNNFKYNANYKDRNDLTELFYYSDYYNSLYSMNNNIYKGESINNTFNIKNYYSKYSIDSINNYSVNSNDNNNTYKNYSNINLNYDKEECCKMNNSNNIKDYGYDNSLRSTYDDDNLKRILSNFKIDNHFENRYKERYREFLNKKIKSNINFNNDCINKKKGKIYKNSNKFSNKVENEYEKKYSDIDIWNEYNHNFMNMKINKNSTSTKNELNYFSTISNIIKGFKNDKVKGNKNKRGENKIRELNKINLFHKNKNYRISKSIKNISLSEFFSDKKLIKKEKKNELSLNYFKNYKNLSDNYKIKFNKKKNRKKFKYNNIYKIRKKGSKYYKKGKWNIGNISLKKKFNSKNKEIENIRTNNLSISYKSRIIKNKNVNKLLKMNMEKEEENIERIRQLFLTFNNNKEKKINNYIHNVFKYISLYSNFNVCYKKEIEILNYKIKIRRGLLKSLYSFYYRHNISVIYKIYKKIEYIYTYLNLLYYNNIINVNLKEMNDEISKYSLLIISKYLKYHIHNSNKLFNSFILKIINYINNNVHRISEFLCMYDYSNLLNILNQYIININISNKLTINKYNLFLFRKNKLIYVPISNILFLYCNNFSLNDIIKILYSHPQYTLFLKSIAINNLVYLYKKSTITNTIYLQLFEYLKVDLGNRVFFFIIFFSFHSFKFLYDFFLNMHTYIKDDYLLLLGYNNLKKGETFLLPLKNNKNSILNKYEDNIENSLVFHKELFFKKNNSIKDFIILCAKKNSVLNECKSYKNKIINNLNINNFIFHKYQNYVKKSDVLSLKCSLIKKIFLENLDTNRRNILLESCHLHNIIFCISKKASQLDKNVQNDFVKMEIKNLLNNYDINNFKLLTNNNKVSSISDNIQILMSATRSPIFLTFKTTKPNIKEYTNIHPFVKYFTNEGNEIKNRLISMHDINNECVIDELSNNNKIRNISSCDNTNNFEKKIKCNEINNIEKIKEIGSFSNRESISNNKKEKNNLQNDTSCVNIKKDMYCSGKINEKRIISNIHDLKKKHYEDISYIYKVNDDVRQDKLVIQTIHIFIHILNEYKLFYNLFPYNIVTNKFFNVYSNEEDEITEKKQSYNVKEKKYKNNDNTNKKEKENENKRKFSFSFYLFNRNKKKKKNVFSDNINKCYHNYDESNNVSKNNKLKEDIKIVSDSHNVNNVSLHFKEQLKNNSKGREFSNKKKKKKKKKFENFGAIIEVLANTKSRHDIGKKFNNIIKYYHLQFSNTNLYIYALKNFISSLAAYSLLSFILQVKDRHNGNLLFDECGNIIHIDFGYILNIYPGISINFELAPFKLTREMIMLLTINSQKKQYFIFSYIQLVVKGYLLLREKSDWIISSILSLSHSDINCFKYNTIEKLKKRLRLNKNDNDASIFMVNKIHQAYNNITTIMYDYIQNIQQGIK
ncbi:phosphatidylinositol 4-kinase, putative [Plasmodium gallinaceum]|uniref:Phosphatidylinositol 4-kinase, putative n=1 Tax=Plasmodium gallinaceum TaxID=5849 RepID=A0A1J1GLE6_PLAGA|nr:phosphatidylinositol 4-kinase, putative [Plasmodium gallinaceum]CRG93230.1 phosphatidylinositol 4-kinase, putative [Plasmodium gallinaceum]